MKKTAFIYISISILTFVSCKAQISNPREEGIFEVMPGDTVLIMDGVINKSSLKNFNKLYIAYPNTKAIHIKQCDGSSDDEVNLQLSFRVHELGFDIHLEDNGLIASGGVDFFLAGIKRTTGGDTQIGVHSWSGLFKEATDFEIGHENHQPYIDYYKSIGFTDIEAEGFYYFTINSAKARDIHWMTDQEIEEYNILAD